MRRQSFTENIMTLQQLVLAESASMTIGNLASGMNAGILPTYGPSWINLYGSARQFKVVGGDEELNEGIGDTPAFRGRLLISIETTIEEGELAGQSTVHREPLRSSSAVVSRPTVDILGSFAVTKL